jgi:hypothetical protein
MRVWAVGALLVRGRDRLVDLGSPDAGHEYAVRARAQDGHHRGVTVVEHRFPNAGAKGFEQTLIRRSHADINLQRFQTEIEQNSASIFLPQRRLVWADFREDAAAVHRTAVNRQTQGDGVTP